MEKTLPAPATHNHAWHVSDNEHTALRGHVRANVCSGRARAGNVASNGTRTVAPTTARRVPLTTETTPGCTAAPVDQRATQLDMDATRPDGADRTAVMATFTGGVAPVMATGRLILNGTARSCNDSSRRQPGQLHNLRSATADARVVQHAGETVVGPETTETAIVSFTAGALTPLTVALAIASTVPRKSSTFASNTRPDPTTKLRQPRSATDSKAGCCARRRGRKHVIEPANVSVRQADRMPRTARTARPLRQNRHYEPSDRNWCTAFTQW